MLRKDQPNKLSWGDAQEQAYCSLKHVITERLVLYLADHGRVFILRTDTCDTGIGLFCYKTMMGNCIQLHFRARNCRIERGSIPRLKESV